MDERILETFDDSLQRCNAKRGFENRFYEIFLASSPKVAEKFANTDFVRQKRALRASLHTILLAVGDQENGPDKYLRDLAEQHSSRELDIGAELYDYWLDSLLRAVEEYDPEYGPEVKDAWEQVMMVGVSYLLSRY